MNIKGVIFDLDGVICHTDHYHYLAWKVIADKLGVSFSMKVNNQLRGVSRMESLEIILKSSDKIFTDKEKLAIAHEKNTIYREMLNDMCPMDIEESVRHTLNTLKEKGFLLAIGSSSKNARYILEKTDCTQYFNAVADGNDITISKPHPEVFTLAGKLLGLEAEQCAVIEDAVAGITAAVSAGMQPIAIGDAAVADVCNLKISTLSELISLLQ